jgi:vacuolar iron transporter family protein
MQIILMRRATHRRKLERRSIEKHSHVNVGITLRDVILGGQDGIVNVLGIILAVALATNDPKLVIITGVAAMLAESMSMAAVAYTSVKAARDFYRNALNQEKSEIHDRCQLEKDELREIYLRKGFSGNLLNRIVRHISSDEELFLKTMMEEELHLPQEDYKNPFKDALVVGFSAMIGSLVPVFPFLFMNVSTGVIASVVISAIVLFFVGVVKAEMTAGNLLKNGLEMAVVGMVAALMGYAIGLFLGVQLYPI